MTEDEDRDESNSKKSKKEKEKKEPPRVPGTVTPDDEALATWIHGLWRGNESPQRIHVVQLFSRGRVFGVVVDREDFHGNKRLAADEAAELSNRFLAAAQADCDKVVRKRQSYGVLAYDDAKASEEYSRYPLDLSPKRIYLETMRSDDEEDDDILDGKSLALKYVQEQIKAAQFDKTHHASVFGEVFILLQGQAQRADQRTEMLMDKVLQMFEQLSGAFKAREEAESMALDREVAREWSKMKISLAKDGIRTARNMLPAFFGDGGSGGEEKQSGTSNGANGHKNGHVKKSMEQVLVDNFLHDCDDTGITADLFGDWDEQTGKCTRPGIFTEAQGLILMRVRDGLLPADALDALLPNSGKPESITPDQVAKAQPLMTEGTGMALMELVGLRNRKREQLANNGKE